MSTRPSRPSAAHRSARRWERADLEPRRARSDDGVGAAEGAEQRTPRSGRPRARHQQRRVALRQPGDVVGGLQGGLVERGQRVGDLRLREDDRGQRAGRLPVGPLGGGVDRVGRGAGEQGAGQALEVALPHAAAALELVGVAGHRGGGQLVDVGEDQLGEARELAGVDPCLDRDVGHVAPRGAGADAVGREQRLDRTSLAGLAAAELVGALDRRRLRGLGVQPGREGEEPAERELHRVADHLAHPPAPRAGIAGHLLDDREDRAVGDLGQAASAGRRRPTGSRPTTV